MFAALLYASIALSTEDAQAPDRDSLGEVCTATCVDVVALVKAQSRIFCADEAKVLPHTVGLVCYGAVEAASSTSCTGVCAALMAGDTYLLDVLLSGAQMQNGHTGLATDYCNQLRVTGLAQKVQKACHKGFQHGLTATTRALSVHIASA
eukprot:17183-Heterococcus_DN1.PRE.1